jgi:hypothetical protein
VIAEITNQRPVNSPALAGLFIGAILLLLSLSGCVTPQVQRLNQQWPANLPEQVLLQSTPFFPQEDFECGPAALATLLQTSGVKVTPEQLAPQVFLPGRKGSLQIELMVASRRHGLPAYQLTPTLATVLQEVAAGHPVLVFQNISLPVYPIWHYAVVIGFDRTRQMMTLRSGVTAQLEMSLSVFERTWARGEYWAMVALPVSELPATAEPDSMVTAVAALERLNPQAAQSAYSTALQRWPAQPLLLMGSGNAAYALGDRTAAAAAYSAAAQADPTLADAWNNLAQVLMEQGQRNEALQALRKALALGGPRLTVYQQLEQQLLAKPANSAP